MYEGWSEGEKRVCRKLVRAALNAGFVIGVHDGEAWAIKRSGDFAAIIDAAGNTEADILRLTKAGDTVGLGNISLVWGNDPSGEELIADYHAVPEIEALVKSIES